MKRGGYVFILFSAKNGTLYTGVTSDLIRRVRQHKQKLFPGFTEKYNIDKLGYFEIHKTIEAAIKREKLIKSKNRVYRLNLIESMNPKWDDMYNNLQQRLFEMLIKQ